MMQVKYVCKLLEPEMGRTTGWGDSPLGSSGCALQRITLCHGCLPRYSTRRVAPKTCKAASLSVVEVPHERDHHREAVQENRALVLGSLPVPRAGSPFPFVIASEVEQFDATLGPYTAASSLWPQVAR